MSMSDRPRSLEELPLKALETALFDAVQDDDAEKVKTLLEQKANPNSKNADGFSALYLATQNNKMSVVQALLKAKADPNIHAEPASSLFGAVKAFFSSQEEAKNTPKVRTPLAVAVDNRNVEIAKLLIEYKADSNVENNFFYPLICQATLAQDVLMVHLLLKAKADVNAKTSCSEKLSSLHVIAKGTPMDPTAYQTIVNLLLTARAEINAKDHNHYTPLHHAAACGNELMVNRLLDSKAAIDFTDDRYDVHLLDAPIINEKVAMVKLLLEKKVSPCPRYLGLDHYRLRRTDGKPENSPIGLAINASPENRMELVKLLLDYKADETFQGCELVKYAVSKKVDVSLVQLLLGRYTLNDKEMLPIFFTALKSNSSPDVIKCLLDAKANALIHRKNKHGNSSLHYAAHLFDVPMVTTLLLEAKANVNESGEQGNTPLHFAVIKNHLAQVTLLLKAKADPRITNDEELTPLSYASDAILEELHRRNEVSFLYGTLKPPSMLNEFAHRTTFDRNLLRLILSFSRRPAPRAVVPPPAEEAESESVPGALMDDRRVPSLS